jgi:hypothetical protein
MHLTAAAYSGFRIQRPTGRRESHYPRRHTAPSTRYSQYPGKPLPGCRHSKRNTPSTTITSLASCPGINQIVLFTSSGETQS